MSKGANIEAKRTDGCTPLHVASFWSKTDIVKHLVSKGANKNAKDKNGETPYDLAKMMKLETLSNENGNKKIKQRTTKKTNA